MIGQIQATWEGERAGVVYASPAGETHALDGTKVKHVLRRPARQPLGRSLPEVLLALPRRAAERGARRQRAPRRLRRVPLPVRRAGGLPRRRPDDEGQEPAQPHARDEGLPPMEACLACHQRSGRHALSYQGLMDGNNGLVPTKGGGPGPLARERRPQLHPRRRRRPLPRRHGVHRLPHLARGHGRGLRRARHARPARDPLRGLPRRRRALAVLRHGLPRERPAPSRVAPVRPPRPARRPRGAHRQGPALLERLRAGRRGRRGHEAHREAAAQQGRHRHARAPHRGARADGVLGLPLAHRRAVLRLPHAVRQAQHRVGLHPGEGDRGRVQRDRGPPPALPLPARPQRPREDLAGDAGLPDVHQRDRGGRHAARRASTSPSTRASRSCASPPSTATTPASARWAAPSATATPRSSASAST